MRIHLYYLFILRCKLSWIQPVKNPSSDLHPFAKLPSFLKNLLIFWHNKITEVHLIPSLLLSGNQPFLSEAQFHFSEECYLEIKIWGQDTFIANRMLLFPSLLRGQSKVIYILVWTQHFQFPIHHHSIYCSFALSRYLLVTTLSGSE